MEDNIKLTAEQQWQDAQEKLMAIIDTIPPEQRGKYQKGLSIYEIVFSTARAVANASKLYPSTNKRIFPKINRRPRNKQKRRFAAAVICTTAHTGYYQALSIMQQPIPKYPLASDAPGGMAMVGEHGPEMINKGEYINIIPVDVTKAISRGGPAEIQPIPGGGYPFLSESAKIDPKAFDGKKAKMAQIQEFIKEEGRILSTPVTERDWNEWITVNLQVADGTVCNSNGTGGFDIVTFKFRMEGAHISAESQAFKEALKPYEQACQQRIKTESIPLHVIVRDLRWYMAPADISFVTLDFYYDPGTF